MARKRGRRVGRQAQTMPSLVSRLIQMLASMMVPGRCGVSDSDGD